MTAAPQQSLYKFAGPGCIPVLAARTCSRWWLSSQLPVTMLCLCLYVPVIGEAQTEFQYFESKGLPAELKSIFKLSVFIPSQEFSTYRQWKQVCVGSRQAVKGSGRFIAVVE